MPDSNYLQGIEEVEAVFGQKYGDARVMVMKKYLDHFSPERWDDLIRITIKECKRLPTIADFMEASRKAWDR